MPTQREVGFFDPETLTDPYRYYERLRSGPVEDVPGVGYLVSRHEDVLAVLRDHATFSSAYSDGFGTSKLALNPRPPSVDRILAEGYPETPALLHTDGATHRRHRSLVGVGFRPSRVAQLEPVITAVADELIDQFVESGQVELFSAFAGPLPLTLIADALGVGRDDLPSFRDWSDALADLRGRVVSEDDYVDRARKFVAFQQYFGSLADDRSRCPRDDLITDIVTARTTDEPPLSKGELMNVFAQLLLAGNETTSSALGAAMHILAGDGVLQRRLRAEPSLIPSVVEEVLRLSSPVLGLPRIATCDTRIGAIDIPAGSRVLVLYGSANRDEGTFHDAFLLELGRPNLRSHVAFGYGAHFCIGAPLARAELRIGLERLLARLGAFELADGFVPEPVGGPMMRRLRRLDLVFTPGAAPARAGEG